MICAKRVVVSVIGCLSFYLLPASVSAAELSVVIENLQPAGGYYFTPVWLGLHDGSADPIQVGSAASAALETVAETGDPGPLDGLFQAMTNGDGTMRVSAIVTAPAGFAGAPVFDPGEVVTTQITVDHPASNRYLSFASMVIPSNDAFFGNDNPLLVSVFQPDGSFAGPITLEITAADVLDAGTEVNNGMGAAFSVSGGTDMMEAGVVGPHPGLDNFLNTETAAGTSITVPLTGDAPLARIHISAVPEPGTAALLFTALPLLLLAARRRRR